MAQVGTKSNVGLILSQPFTWVACATVIALEVAFFRWFQPSLTMSAAATALGLMLLLLWPILYVRSPDFARRFFQLPDEFLAEHAAQVDALARDFSELAFEQGRVQLDLLRDKFDNLAEVLRRRLNTTELTHGRYFGMAEQVYLAALDNLHETAVALRSISKIDPDHLESRIGELRSGDGASRDRQREVDALSERRELYAEQQRRIDGLMAQNEAAMTVLDKTATSLAETKTGKALSGMDAESAMMELELLAKRVSKYAASS